MKSGTLFVMLVFFFSCSHIEPLTQEKIFALQTEAQNLRERYMGDQKHLERVAQISEKLKKNDPYISNLLMSWVSLKKGYINSDSGYERRSIGEAQHLIHTAIKINKRRWEAWSDLTFLYLGVQHLENAKKSFQNFNKLTLFQNDKKYLFQKSLMEMEMNLLEKKMPAVQSTFAKCYNYAASSYNKIRCLHFKSLSYEYVNDYKSALDVRKEAYSLLPKEPWILGNLAMVYFKLKNYQESAKYYEEAIKVRPYPLALSNLAFTYAVMAHVAFQEKRIKDAGELIEKSLALKSIDSQTTLYLYQAAREDFKDEELVKKILAEGERLNPKSGVIAYFIGSHNLNSLEDDFDKAETYFFKALKDESKDMRNPDFIGAALGIAYLNLWKKPVKDFENSLQVLLDVEKYISTQPDQAGSFYFYLASVYHELGWKNKDAEYSRKALTNYQKSIDLKYPEKARILQNMELVKANIRNFLRR